MSATWQRAMPEEGPVPRTVVHFGKYELLQCIAKGGMGEIFLARPSEGPDADERVAVKVLPGDMAEDEGSVRMFLDEARILSKVSHPNVARLLDFGQSGDAHYIAMEYVRGESLQKIQRAALVQGKPFPLSLAARIASDAAAGLHGAHVATDANGAPLRIVHRDVSPQNILVTFEGQVKVIDFGIAWAENRESATVLGVVKGKAGYMAPEQVSGRPVDRRTDVFALGIVLHELTTGRLLFRGDSAVAVMEAIRSGQVAPPSATRPEIDPALDEIILKALRRDPQERYQDAAALRTALEGWISRQSQSATTGDLGALMQELFPERAGQARRDDQLLAPEQTVGSSLFPALAADAPPPEAPAPRTASLARPRVAMAAGAAAILSVGIGIGAWLADRGATPAVVPPPAQAQPVRISPEEQRLVLARELLEKGELDGAQALLQPAPAGIAADGLRQTIQQQRSLLAQAEQLQQGEDCPAAIAIWREALRLNPKLRAAKAGLGECTNAPAAPRKAAKPAREGGYSTTVF